MKVLHVITDLYQGGAQEVLYKLISEMDRRRFEPIVISLLEGGPLQERIEKLNVPVYSLRMRRSFPTMQALLRLRRLVRELRPDLIQGWMYHGNLAASLARALSPGRSKLAWSIHHSLSDLSLEKQMTRWIIRANRFFSSSPNSILYCSQLSREQHEKLSFVSRNGWIIPNGVDLQRHSFSPVARQKVRVELGIPANAPVVGHVARFHPMKDHATLLRASVNLANQYPDAHFLLIGRNVSLENAVLSQGIPAQIRDRFYLLGERYDVPDLMSAMDIFCLSSSFGEAFPVVLCEAMATRIPCVATDVGDSKIIIGDTGVVVKPRDETALAAGIESLLTMPLEERRALGESARARIKANYTLGVIVEHYAALYEKLMVESGRKNKNHQNQIHIDRLYNDQFKRGLDVIFAIILFLLTLPLVGIIAIIIKFSSQGPVFYRPLRGGYHQKPFRIFKFRTMVANADKIGGGTTALNDPRITKIGKILRKTKLDESPQLINIIFGEMSFIGPRPELLEYTENYSEIEQNILEVRPGITDISSIKFISLDEVVGSENADEYYEKKVLRLKNKLRLEYVQKQSFILDLSLFFKTVYQVLKKMCHSCQAKGKEIGTNNIRKFNSKSV
ncbi:MAG: sugar transferase [Candidatus Omnitrophica bacterium]|nr:sugar transferase [Candidatus Omnitrophota bacterium]